MGWVATLRAASCRAEHCSHLSPDALENLNYLVFQPSPTTGVLSAQNLGSGADNAVGTQVVASWSVVGKEKHATD